MLNVCPVPMKNEPLGVERKVDQKDPQQRGLWFPGHKRHRVMANSCHITSNSTYNIYIMLNITSKLKMPLKMSSPQYLLANIDTQQIQNNLTAVLYKIIIWQPNQNHLRSHPSHRDKVQTGGEGLHYFHTLSQFAQMEILKQRFDVPASPEEFLRTITGMNVLN